MSEVSGRGERSVQHHPSEMTLATYANGSLGRLPALVVATHLSFCATCRATAHLVETAGGLLIEQLPPTPLAPDALDWTLARLDRPPDTARADETSTLLEPQPSVWPPPLHGLRVGRFRWLGPGVHFAELLRSGDELLGLLRLRAGVIVPLHAHRGTELTCVLEGAYRDETGLYGPGDIEQADKQVRHRPVVQASGDCLCLVATRGRLRFATVLSRLWQPFQPF